MRMVFDVGHPAHVHHFKNVIRKLSKKNHKIMLLSRDKDVAFELLSAYKLDYVAVGKNYKNLIKKAVNQLMINLKTLKICMKFKPDILVGRASPNLAFASLILSIPFISFSDTEHARINLIFSFPFAKTIVTPSCFMKDLGKKNIRINSYFELAYLHQNYFKPDPNILNLLDVEKNEKYVIMRFISWNASHDIGYKGLSSEMKIKIVKELSKYTKVFISSEEELPYDLKKYQIKIPPERMHDVLYYATLLYGESATMASECAVLGTPAIYLDNVGRGYTNEQEKKYELVFNFTESLIDQELSLKKGIELLNTPNLKREWQKRRQKMISEKIDITAFIVWLIENYPASVKIVKNNPGYQFNFK